MPRHAVRKKNLYNFFTILLSARSKSGLGAKCLKTKMSKDLNFEGRKKTFFENDYMKIKGLRVTCLKLKLNDFFLP
jgi:hypothetical protein